jgi:Integrase core domain
VRFVAEQPTERWQLDITHWALADDSEVEILNLLDDHSRVCLASQARRVFKAGDVDDCFGIAATHYRYPATVLSDNGAVVTGRSRARAAWPSRSPWPAEGSGCAPPGLPPQTCGKVERFHQTLKNWLTTRPRARTLRQLQAQLDSFRSYYNTKRPHRALGRRTPIQAYQARPKAVPTGLPLDDTQYRIRHDKIDPSGVFTLGHNSRLHHIGVGRRHAGTDILVLVHDRHVRVLTHDGELLRELQLDPSKDYQPQRQT